MGSPRDSNTGKGIPRKPKTKAAKRPSRDINEKPSATQPKGAAGKGKRPTATKGKRPLAAAKPAFLSGGNPQIAKADGDAPVQAYIAAMPGWKRDVGRRLDALFEHFRKMGYLREPHGEPVLQA